MIKLCTNTNYELTVYYADHNMSDIMVTSEYGERMTLEHLYLTNQSAYVGPDSNNSDSFILENLLFSLLMEQVSYLSELLREISSEPVENVTIQNNNDRIMNLVDIKNSLIKKLDEEEKKKKLFGDTVHDPLFKIKTKGAFFDYLLNFYELRYHTIQEADFDITSNQLFSNHVKEFYSDMVGIYSSEKLLESYDIHNATDMYDVLVCTKKMVLNQIEADKANLK